MPRYRLSTRPYADTPQADLIGLRECTAWWLAELHVVDDVEFPAARDTNIAYAKAELAAIDQEIARRQRASSSRYAPQLTEHEVREPDPDLWRRIKEGFDLREFIAYHVVGLEWIPAGRVWKTSCPLGGHADTDPSFYVYPDDHYHCFGCGAHGSVIDFAMDLYRVDFHRAVEILVEAANVALLYRGDLDLLRRIDSRQAAPVPSPATLPGVRRSKKKARIVRRDGQTLTPGR